MVRGYDSSIEKEFFESNFVNKHNCIIKSTPGNEPQLICEDTQKRCDDVTKKKKTTAYRHAASVRNSFLRFFQFNLIDGCYTQASL